jgi:uncharacterized membrane protein
VQQPAAGEAAMKEILYLIPGAIVGLLVIALLIFASVWLALMVGIVLLIFAAAYLLGAKITITERGKRVGYWKRGKFYRD